MTREILLLGTPESEPNKRLLRAGNLSATFDAGALRWISWNGIEITRAVMFLLRTPGWGTPAGRIEGLSIDEDAEMFRVSYTIRYREGDACVSVEIAMTGTSRGTLDAEATIRAEAPFETNRTGFVVLHPLDGFVGAEVHVDHASGPAQDMTIPVALSPGQPVMDMRAITHRPVPGLEVRTDFEGDIFEMEDHRMWTDASLKTYNRPIGLPHPYTLDPSEPVQQAVRLTLIDTGATGAPPEPAVTPPTVAGKSLPRFALPLDCVADAAAALPFANTLRTLGPPLVLLRFDTSREGLDADTAPLAELLRATGAGLELQAVLSATSDAEGAAQVAAIAGALSAAGLMPERVSAFAKIDEQSFQPGQARPDHASEAALSEALARHFPEAARIGGTPAFFTEFNRKRPEPGLWDGVTFATTPVVHAHDDASVMETLQALPHTLTSAMQLAGGKPLSCGPTGIGARLNPYGPGPTDNAPTDREGMARRDPRQRGLFAAAWITGYLARIAPFGIDRFAFGAPTGPFGVISSNQPYARPFWDELPEGAVYPLFHVARWIAAATGATLDSARTEDRVAWVVWRQGDRGHALIANLTTDARPTPDLPWPARAVILDCSTVETLAQATAPSPEAPLPTSLDAYAVVFAMEETKP